MSAYQQPWIFVLDSSGHVLTAIEQLQLPGRCQSVDDWNEMTSRCTAHFGSIGIVAVDEKWSDAEIANCLIQARRATECVPPTLLLALVTPAVGRFARELLRAGFANVYRTRLDIGRLATAAEAWWNSLEWPAIRIEEQVARDLPWADNG